MSHPLGVSVGDTPCTIIVMSTPTTNKRKGDGYSTCWWCGCDELFSQFFNANGEYDPNGEYRTICITCSAFQP
jgi:hypothetical protein